MFPRKQRLAKSEEIKFVLNKGKKKSGKYVRIAYYFRDSILSRAVNKRLDGKKAMHWARFTVIVGKKQVKKAVLRNKLKRRYRALAAKHKNMWIKLADIILLPKKEALHASFIEIEKDYVGLVAAIRLK